MNGRRTLTVGCSALAALWALPLWAAETAPASEAAIGVVVGIAPMAGLVERIGGDRVKVQSLSPPGQCVHELALTPKQTMDLGKARLLIVVGMPFEEQLAKKLGDTHPKLIVIDAAQGIKRRPLSEECHHDEHAAPGHACGGSDPHVWLAPGNLKTLAISIAAALENADPAQRATYQANLKRLTAEIDQVHARLEKALGPLRGRTIWVYHPAFGYLTDAYGLKQEAVEIGGKAPSPRALRELIHRARAAGVKAIFVEPQSDQRGAELVAKAIGCAVVPMDALSKDPVKNLDVMAAKIGEAAGK